MRKIHKRKFRKKDIIKREIMIILSLFSLTIILATGYSAFSTNLTLNTKGNIKIEYKTVNFKTELLTNNTFDKGLDNWEYNGSASQLTYEIDETLTHGTSKSMRIYEKEESTNYNGPNQKINIPFDSTKIYELSAYFYRDENSTYGDLTNKVRMYATLGDETGGKDVWLKLDNTNDTNEECRTGNCTAIFKHNLPNKTWTYISAKGNEKTKNNASVNKIIRFNIDYLAEGSKNSSNIWISEPHFYEIEVKQIKKGNKLGLLPTPQKEGYTFNGWYTEETYENQINENTIIKENTNFYAKFTKI